MWELSCLRGSAILPPGGQVLTGQRFTSHPSKHPPVASCTDAAPSLAGNSWETALGQLAAMATGRRVPPEFAERINKFYGEAGLGHESYFIA
ncbi:MAG: hypothetical protein Q6J46_02945 [Thermostichus sp. DG02_2_bins_29]